MDSPSKPMAGSSSVFTGSHLVTFLGSINMPHCGVTGFGGLQIANLSAFMIALFICNTEVPLGKSLLLIIKHSNKQLYFMYHIPSCQHAKPFTHMLSFTLKPIPRGGSITTQVSQIRNLKLREVDLPKLRKQVNRGARIWVQVSLATEPPLKVTHTVSRHNSGNRRAG